MEHFCVYVNGMVLVLEIKKQLHSRGTLLLVANGKGPRSVEEEKVAREELKRGRLIPASCRAGCQGSGGIVFGRSRSSSGENTPFQATRHHFADEKKRRAWKLERCRIENCQGCGLTSLRQSSCGGCGRLRKASRGLAKPLIKMCQPRSQNCDKHGQINRRRLSNLLGRARAVQEGGCSRFSISIVRGRERCGCSRTRGCRRATRAGVRRRL